VPDRRSLLRGRLATAIDGVADVAAGFDPPTPRPAASAKPKAPTGRPWTVLAAMEPIASPTLERVTPPPPRAQPPAQAPESVLASEPPEHHRFPIAIVGSALLGLVVILVIVLRLLHSTPAGPSTVIGQIELTAVRPVASSAPAGGLVPPTQVSFPAGTRTVSIEVNSSAAHGQALVDVIVSAGDPPAAIINHSYVLDPSGDTLIPLAPASGGFAPGEYSVTITRDGATLGSTAFDVH
jgi:hypothetical protein